MSDARAKGPPRISVTVGLGGRAILPGGVAVISGGWVGYGYKDKMSRRWKVFWESLYG